MSILIKVIPNNNNSSTQLLNNVTLDNYNQVLNITRMAVMAAVTDKQKQTKINLAIVAAAFAQSAKLINEHTIIPNAVSLHCCYQGLCHQIWCVIMALLSFFRQWKT